MTVVETIHVHHEHHHALIAERGAAYESAPRRTAADRIQRREAYKRFVWTLVGHLRCCHGWRGNSVAKSDAYLTALHDARSE